MTLSSASPSRGDRPITSRPVRVSLSYKALTPTPGSTGAGPVFTRAGTALMAEKITPRAADYPQWYLDVVKQAGLADNSDVRGGMVITPTGYALWERMQ